MYVQQKNLMGGMFVSFIKNYFNPQHLVPKEHRLADDMPTSKEVLHSTRCNPDIYRLVKGLMIESYIEDGCQKAGEGVYGKSITDPCLGWEKTERLIYDLAELR